MWAQAAIFTCVIFAFAYFLHFLFLKENFSEIQIFLLLEKWPKMCKNFASKYGTLIYYIFDLLSGIVYTFPILVFSIYCMNFITFCYIWSNLFTTSSKNTIKTLLYKAGFFFLPKLLNLMYCVIFGCEGHTIFYICLILFLKSIFRHFLCILALFFLF